jgi:hypothetical protein
MNAGRENPPGGLGKIDDLDILSVETWSETNEEESSKRNGYSHNRFIKTLMRAPGGGKSATPGEVDPIEILMEFLFDLLRTVEFRPRLLNVRIGRESL